MSYRKARVHLTGKSNADVRTVSTSPTRVRVPIQERSFVQTSNSFVKSVEDPLNASVQKYKTWNKKLRSNIKEPAKNINILRMQEDPPNFANVRKKVELLRIQQENSGVIVSSLQNELSRFVKTQGVSIRSQFIKADKAKKGVLTFEEFRDTLESVNAPDSLVRNSRALYKELGGGEDGLNYKQAADIITPVDTFLPMIENNEPQQIRLRVIDKKSAPLNQLENIYNNSRKVRQFLKAAYQTPEGLLADLNSISTKDRIQMQTLQDFVVSKLEESKSTQISIKEMEGFLASYDYNKDKATSVSEVAKYVFMDDILAASHLHIKKRAIPPLREAQKSDTSVSDLKTLLLNIETKMFTQGPNQSLAVFKIFDKDADGYLTLEDLEQGLVASQIPHTSRDTLKLMEFLDENSNGFVSFSEFSKAIQPNILTVNHQKFEEPEEKYYNISQPSTKYHELQQSKMSVWKPQEAKEFQLKFSTRYSASPPHQNTFTNFAPGSECAMFSSDKDRFRAKKFEPININHDDKDKLRRSADARIMYLQKTREIQENRIKEINEREIVMDSMRITKRMEDRKEYDAKCKAGMMS